MNEIITYNGQDVFIGFAKEPLMPTKGFGYLGVKMQTLDKTKIMCHECGEFFKRLHTKHLNTHGLSIDEYKMKHGFSKTTAMISDTESIKISRNIVGRSHCIGKANKKVKNKAKDGRGKARKEGKTTWINSNERQNKYGTCEEQMKQRLRIYINRFQELPSSSTKNEDGIAIYSLLQYRYGSANVGFAKHGLPMRKYIYGQYVEYSFIDGTTIKCSYSYPDCWNKLYKKIVETSPLFNDIEIEDEIPKLLEKVENMIRKGVKCLYVMINGEAKYLPFTSIDKPSSTTSPEYADYKERLRQYDLLVNYYRNEL